MGSASQPLKSKLFLAIMYQPTINVGDIVRLFSNEFGTVENTYGPIAFSFSNYYEDEMGSGLFKTYLNFERPIDRNVLPRIKNFTNSLESKYVINAKRTVNIDPGYIAKDKLVLASTKDFYHRLYLADGIYGEVTLHFRKGKFRYFSWTYPDYMDPPFLEFLTKARARLVKELRTEDVA